MSSGSGEYSEDYKKEDLSDDSDIQMIKVLTVDRNAKKQVAIDTDRIEQHKTVGRSKAEQKHIGLSAYDF